MGRKKKESGVALAAKGLEPKIVKVTEELSCELNQVEWENRARELAEANQEVVSQEQRKKDVTKQLGSDVGLAKAKASKLTNVVATRHEQRDVTVEVKYDYELGTVTKRRTDTDEIVSTREMTDNERQQELDLQAPELPEGEKPAEEPLEDIGDVDAEEDISEEELDGGQPEAEPEEE